MKLCIPSTGSDLDSKVQKHFGRADFFIIVNTDSEDFKAIPNVAHAPGRGTGAEAAQLVLENGAEAVLTGVIGPNAFNALKVGHVDVYEGLSADETARRALQRFKGGQYSECVTPTGGPSLGS